MSWIVPNSLLACRFPRSDSDLRELAEAGIRLLVNLDEQAHSPERLAAYGLRQIHLPVRDFSAPSQATLERGVQAIEDAMAQGIRVAAAHCGGGLGRTGTLVACLMVKRGLGPDQAIAEVRALRPGSIETAAQEQAVHAFARSLGR